MAEEMCPLGRYGGGIGAAVGVSSNQVVGKGAPYSSGMFGQQGQYAGQGNFIPISNNAFSGVNYNRAAGMRPNPNVFYGSQFINQVQQQQCPDGYSCSSGYPVPMAQQPPMATPEQAPTQPPETMQPGQFSTSPQPQQPEMQDMGAQMPPQQDAGQASPVQDGQSMPNMGGSFAGGCPCSGSYAGMQQQQQQQQYFPNPPQYPGQMMMPCGQPMMYPSNQQWPPCPCSGRPYGGYGPMVGGPSQQNLYA